MATLLALLPILGALIPLLVHEYYRAEKKRDDAAPERLHEQNEKLIAVGSDRDLSVAVSDKLRALQELARRP